MPEPQSTEFFLILVAVFGALVWWVIVAKQLVFRILAACLAFIPAMAFGVAAVNKYYDYYQTWHAAISDLTNQGVQTANAPNVTSRPGTRFASLLGQTVNSGLAAQQGFTLQLTMTRRPDPPAPQRSWSTCRRSTSSPPTSGTGSRSSS